MWRCSQGGVVAQPAPSTAAARVDQLPSKHVTAAGGTPHLDKLLKDIETTLEHLDASIEEQVGRALLLPVAKLCG
jgi:hypothetical protein